MTIPTVLRRAGLAGVAVVGMVASTLPGTVTGRAAPAGFGTQLRYAIPPPAGQPFHWSYIPDLASGAGAVWVAGGQQNAIGSVTTPGGDTPGSVSAVPVNISNTRCAEKAAAAGQPPPAYCADHIHDVAVGPNGNIWFAVIHTGEPAPTRVLEMTPSGSILLDLAVPESARTGNFAPVVGITAGRDGSVWYVNSSNGAGVAPNGANVGAVTAKIVRVALDGTQTEFDVAPNTDVQCCGVGGIVAAPDGLYFGANGLSNTSQGYIERISYAGATTGVWALSATSGTPFSLALRHGDIWFVDNNGVGTLDPARGTFTEFPASGVGGLTIGGDGNIWFSESNSNTIVRMAPNGTILGSFSTSPLTSPSMLTTGGNGNVYYGAAGSAAAGGAQVGEIVVCSGNNGNGVGNGDCDRSAAAGNH